VHKGSEKLILEWALPDFSVRFLAGRAKIFGQIFLVFNLNDFELIFFMALEMLFAIDDEKAISDFNFSLSLFRSRIAGGR
jgi:hypothetical protein